MKCSKCGLEFAKEISPNEKKPDNNQEKKKEKPQCV